MSIAGPPPDEEEEEEEEADDPHKAWETRAAIAHLLGLCEALESVERSTVSGERLGVGRRLSVKGKEREGSEATGGKGVGGSHLQALHDHLTYLVTMYRRGLLKATDPPVRLPVSQPPELLQTTGTPNVFRFGRRVAGSIVDRTWVKEAAESAADGQEDAVVKSIAVHARYLLALTSQDKEPQAAIKHLQAVLAIIPLSYPEAVELASSSRRRLTSLQARMLRVPSAPPSSTSRFLDPRTASPRVALGKGTSSLPFPKRLSPNQATASVSTSHLFASASLSPASPMSSAQDSLPIPRNRHSSAPPLRSPSDELPPGPGGTEGGFTSRMRRATSTFSNMTANSISSLSPSLFSLKLQDERSEQAPCLVDDLLVHGQTAGPSSPRASPWAWFGRRSVAEGSLRSLASANGRVASPTSVRGPPPSRATKSSRPPIPSSSKPRVIASVPASPGDSGLVTPLSRPPAFKTQASDYGDKSLDPQLRQLEMSSKVTRMAACSVCGTEGVNLPECPRCRLLFCSRGCRIGEDAAGDGKKHICGLLETRREVAAVDAP